ncbi:MAG: FAD-binding oxidoreductase [Gammaproteobacteria bacterium]|nr:FAD-binding oxidoreductase [Gammaproteobacteria bacterium]MBU1776838.1 FAD-binding oxidoreductase [Gammaproteobacteria bacterium]MBU1968050.1 FAD-binding oxidoreductase [Gammaproteobacteria bacterium]
MTTDAKFLEAIAAIIGGDAVLTGEAANPHFKDWRGRYAGEAVAVVFPSDTEQVSEVVKLCAANKVAIVPQGGNTSLCGASVPLSKDLKQIVINLSRMNRIRALDAVNYTMTVEAGCKLASLYEAPEQADRIFPLGLTAIAPHCEIGGNLSTNAGGLNVLRYGTARDLVLGLEVVLPDGRIWNGLRSLRKDNSGYDLKHLFIGAEGTLGIITAAVVKLFPRPKSVATACIAVRDPAAAVALLAHLRSKCGDKISGFEIVSRSCLDLVFRHISDTQEPFAKQYDWIVITQLADVLPMPLDTAMRDAFGTFGEGILEYDITTDKDHAERWWRLRKNIAEAQKTEGISIKHDISVPISRAAEFIMLANAALRSAFPGIRIVAFGHLGDGNIHYNASMPDAAENKTFIEQHEPAVHRMVYEVVARLDGSISAEHGLGQLKRDEITHYKSPLELEMMRNIKRTLDPHGLMNPGKVI